MVVHAHNSNITPVANVSTSPTEYPTALEWRSCWWQMVIIETLNFLVFEILKDLWYIVL